MNIKKWLAFFGLCAMVASASVAHAAASWAGTYVGIQTGFAHSNSEYADLDDDYDNQEMNGISDDGSTTGLYVGYGRQNGSLVYGVEAAYAGLDNENVSRTGNIFATPPEVLRTELSNLISLKARMGVAVDNSLLFLGVGPAWVKLDFVNDNGGAVFSNGLTVQGLAFAYGIETQVFKNWALRLQAEQVQLRTFVMDDTLNDNPFGNTTSLFNVTFGAAYRF